MRFDGVSLGPTACAAARRGGKCVGGDALTISQIPWNPWLGRQDWHCCREYGFDGQLQPPN